MFFFIRIRFDLALLDGDTNHEHGTRFRRAKMAPKKGKKKIFWICRNEMNPDQKICSGRTTLPPSLHWAI